MKQHDAVIATFNPKNTGDLAAHAVAWIGQRTAWTAGWKIEDGDYRDQFAMIPLIVPAGLKPIAWVPEQDLTDLEPVESLVALQNKQLTVTVT